MYLCAVNSTVPASDRMNENFIMSLLRPPQRDSPKRLALTSRAGKWGRMCCVHRVDNAMREDSQQQRAERGRLVTENVFTFL